MKETQLIIRLKNDENYTPGAMGHAAMEALILAGFEVISLSAHDAEPSGVKHEASPEAGKVTLEGLLTFIRVSTVLACVWSIARFAGAL